MRSCSPYIYKYTIPILLLVWIMACGVPLSPEYKARVSIKKENGKYGFYINDTPFVVKGGSGYMYIRELAELGGNTLKTWDTTGLQEILDEAAAQHVYVIAGLDMPVSGYLDFYKDTSSTREMINAYLRVVSKFRNHPALLSWCLGNELDFPSKPNFQPFYNAFNTLLREVKIIDPDHPVTTTLMNFSRRNLYNYKLRIHELDYISINIFGNIEELGQRLDDFSWWWNGPYMITEWAPSGGWESEVNAWQAPLENSSKKKAELFGYYYNNHIPFGDGRILGNLAFYWGMKQEFTHTWFSIFTEDGHPTEILEELRDCWNGKKQKHLSPPLEYFLLNGKGGYDNILLSPGEQSTAYPLFTEAVKEDSHSFTWELIGEHWENRYKTKLTKPEPEPLENISGKMNEIVFKAPAEKGAYRLFFTVVNRHGYAATANVPFYVNE